MGLGQDKGRTTSVQRSDPWAGVQPYLQDVYGEASNQYWSPNAWPQAFPYSAVAPRARETEDALQAQAARARAGSPLLGAAQSEAARTIEGTYQNAGPAHDYLRGFAAYPAANANPYLDSQFDRAADRVRARIEAPFVAGGRYGSGAQAEAVARAATDLASELYGSAYESDRSRQFSAAAALQQAHENERERQARYALASPALAAADYGDFAQLAGVGARREHLGQAQLSDEAQHWNFEQALPQAMLDRYLSILTGAPGGTVTTTQSGPRGPDFLGGALGGARLAGNLNASDPLSLRLTLGGGLLGLL